VPNKTLLDVYQAPDDYDLVHGGATDDVAFWLELCLKLKPASILELATGTGRLLLPLARAGYPVTGLDLVPAMLNSAARRLALEPAEVRAQVRLEALDMRSFALGKAFDLVFIGYNSVLHLVTADDREATFAAAYRHTAPGGRFVVDVFNPDLAMLSAAQRAATPGDLEMALEDPATGRRVFRSASHRYDDASQTVTTHYVTEEALRGRPLPVTEEMVDYHIFYPEELRLLFSQASFAMEAVYGAYSFEALEAGSPRIIMVGRRPA